MSASAFRRLCWGQADMLILGSTLIEDLDLSIAALNIGQREMKQIIIINRPCINKKGLANMVQ